MQFDLFEIIAHDPKTPAKAFGVIFGDSFSAKQYAHALEARGYTVEISPTFATYADANSALADAAGFFADPGLEPGTRSGLADYLVAIVDTDNEPTQWLSHDQWTQHMDDAERLPDASSATLKAASWSEHFALKGKARSICVFEEIEIAGQKAHRALTSAEIGELFK
mgnify:CR=1 FL=1